MIDAQLDVTEWSIGRHTRPLHRPGVVAGGEQEDEEDQKIFHTLANSPWNFLAAAQ